jgi:hypothetical protein
VAGSLGSLVPTLGFIPMLYVKPAPFDHLPLFTQIAQGPLSGLRSRNGKFTLFSSRWQCIDLDLSHRKYEV